MRMTNGDAVIKRLRCIRGIPWMAIYDSGGNPPINSDGPNGNTGYPGEPEGQVHFKKMLRTGTKHLTEDDIKSLFAALRRQQIRKTVAGLYEAGSFTSRTFNYPRHPYYAAGRETVSWLGNDRSRTPFVPMTHGALPREQRPPPMTTRLVPD